MNSHNISVETEKINSQLQRADLKKNILIRSINREYEFYLNLLRDLLYISVEKGVTELFNDSSINDDFLNANGLLTLLEKKISNLIYRKLPLITVEQLKINSIEEYINEEINFNGLGISLTKKDDKDLLLTSSELNDMSTPNVLVTSPGPEANLSSFLETKTDLISTPLAKFSLSVTTFKQ